MSYYNTALIFNIAMHSLNEITIVKVALRLKLMKIQIY